VKQQGPVRLDTMIRSLAMRLAKAGVEPAFTEARLIAELAGFERVAMLRAPETLIAEPVRLIMETALARRIGGEPIARQRGWTMFDGRRFGLSPATLEPRDDTLALVDLVTPIAASRPGLRILDIGTGTGIIALTLLARAPQAVAVATDISAQALETARANAQALGLAERFRAVEADLASGIAGPFDLVVSNPPYIASGVIAELEREVREHDPVAALDGGADGLAFYRRIAAASDGLLAAAGSVGVEIGHDQRDQVPALFAVHGFDETALRHDAAGRPRALLFARDRA
jgi:release factor glutamine methyltransferase